MDEFMRNTTEPARRAMRHAAQAAKQAGRRGLTPPDVFRALLDMPDGLHLRFLADALHLDMNKLRALARDWELPPGPEHDWTIMILANVAAEAVLDRRRLINTEDVLLALLRVWPEAPCSVAILKAAGGTIHYVRRLISEHW